MELPPAIYEFLVNRNKPSSKEGDEKTVIIQKRWELDKAKSVISYIDDYEVVRRIIALENLEGIDLPLAGEWSLHDGSIVYQANPSEPQPSVRVGYETQVQGVLTPDEVFVSSRAYSDTEPDKYYVMEAGKVDNFPVLTLYNSESPDFSRQYVYSYETNSFVLRYPEPSNAHLWAWTAILLYVAIIIVIYTLIREAAVVVASFA